MENQKTPKDSLKTPIDSFRFLYIYIHIKPQISIFNGLSCINNVFLYQLIYKNCYVSMLFEAKRLLLIAQKTPKDSLRTPIDSPKDSY